MKFLVKTAHYLSVGLAISIFVTVTAPALGQVIHFDNPPATAPTTPTPATKPEVPATGAASSTPSTSATSSTAAATSTKASPAAVSGTHSTAATTANTAPSDSAATTAPAASTSPTEAPPGQNVAPTVVAPSTPKLPDNVPPKGMPAAMKLFNSGKYALAQKEFEKFINTGVADEETHMNLAYCLYYQRKYTQALKQFDWVNKNAKHSLSMQMKGQNTAAAIRSCMRGICPGQCLKPTDPRWQVIPSLGSGKWCKFTESGSTGTGWHAFSEAHMGDIIQVVNGKHVDMGPCPICGGRGTVTPLKDGGALPGQ